jgi:hypothetical protein
MLKTETIESFVLRSDLDTIYYVRFQFGYGMDAISDPEIKTKTFSAVSCTAIKTAKLSVTLELK